MPTKLIEKKRVDRSTQVEIKPVEKKVDKSAQVEIKPVERSKEEQDHFSDAHLLELYTERVDNSKDFYSRYEDNTLNNEDDEDQVVYRPANPHEESAEIYPSIKADEEDSEPIYR